MAFPLSFHFLILVISVSVFIIPRTNAQGEPCNLNDTQKTQGECKDIKECPFAIDQLRAGIQPTTCSGRIVCCPTELTLSAKKCEEYKEYLRIPFALHVTDPDEELPITCLVDAPGGFIAGGRDAHLFEYPHVVALGWGKDKKNLRYQCTGTLISESYILTAAHCITSSANGPPNFALLGDIALSEEKAGDFREVIPIEKCIVHPNYEPPFTYNDVALVKLNTTLSLSRYLLPACLPQAGDKINGVLEAVGFGLLGPGEPQTNILQSVNLTGVRTKECQEFYDTASDKERRFPEGLIKMQLCAGDSTDSGKDTCNGDSGGPLTINKEFRCVFHVMGITSFGARLCGYGQPAVFTKVFSYNDWIESIVWGGDQKSLRNSLHSEESLPPQTETPGFHRRR